jgi:hypothetical protein
MNNNNSFQDNVGKIQNKSIFDWVTDSVVVKTKPEQQKGSQSNDFPIFSQGHSTLNTKNTDTESELQNLNTIRCKCKVCASK